MVDRQRESEAEFQHMVRGKGNPPRYRRRSGRD